MNTNNTNTVATTTNIANGATDHKEAFTLLVKSQLESGQLKAVPTSATIQQLSDQINVWVPKAEKRQSRFFDVDVDAVHLLNVAKALVSLAGASNYKQSDARDDIDVLSARFRDSETALIALKVAAIKLARESGISESVFKTAMVRGQTVLESSLALEAALRGEIDNFQMPKVAQRLLDEVVHHLSVMRDSDEQRARLRSSRIDLTADKNKARQACYAVLLKINSVASVIFAAESDIREEFALRVIFPKRSVSAVGPAPVDAPVAAPVGLSSDATASDHTPANSVDAVVIPIVAVPTTASSTEAANAA